ncbi:hypothetical protein M427DRAFT_51951 [Gonapodya prolifera JEL478]|uniref:Uncharacterized protein n=1 Tax=Gonapodya prolifera (strain JEL478) TaxID=1344416 RepID=A0A139AWB0_GONPJ|nr:hypothetical protein M427DRAFT_51951 [Gonapodya prolifera JEL478]|eukprot:KXS21008.1 hypothetical protein M427DRAFT_51951 [Gonapodya prolifera JEL478]
MLFHSTLSNACRASRGSPTRYSFVLNDVRRSISPTFTVSNRFNTGLPQSTPKSGPSHNRNVPQNASLLLIYSGRQAAAFSRGRLMSWAYTCITPIALPLYFGSELAVSYTRIFAVAIFLGVVPHVLLHILSRNYVTRMWTRLLPTPPTEPRNRVPGRRQPTAAQPEIPLVIETFRPLFTSKQTFDVTTDMLRYEPNYIFSNWAVFRTQSSKSPVQETSPRQVDIPYPSRLWRRLFGFGSRRRFYVDPLAFREQGEVVWLAVRDNGEKVETEEGEERYKGGWFARWSRDE